MAMKWFKEIFLPSFEVGKEVRISEKQYDIFLRYARNFEEKCEGFLESIAYSVDDKHIVISKHRCKYGATYWLIITKG